MDALILSNALDTNGQNARYARASEKWGTHDGVLSALAVGHYDPAGVVGRFKEAADKYGTLRIRSVHRAQHIYQQMPADILWTRTNHRAIRDMALAADIVHLNNSAMAARRLRIPRGMPYLLHHHGSLFRNNPKQLLAEARMLGAVQAVSTVDLMRPAPELLHWLPTAYDIDALAAMASKREPDGRVKVVSCPTNRAYKSTDALEAAVVRLQAEGLPIFLEVVWNKTWAESMAVKSTADIYFDQVAVPDINYPGGYGCNAIEAWGMGIPVVAGADEWTEAKMTELWGSLPFYHATVDTIADALRTLATSKAQRTKWAKAGMAHIRRYHDELPALIRLAELYHMAINQQVLTPGTHEPPPATFTAKVPQLRVAGRYVTFVNGQHTTDNPHIATALRLMATRHPKYGIEEVA